MFFMGGWFIVGISFIASAILAIILEKFVLNKRLPVPSNAAVVITGCSTGIGADATLRLISKGVLVYAGVRRDADGEALKARAGDRANLVVPIICDVTNNEQITAAVATVTRHMTANDRQLLALINNAGYSETAPMEVISGERLQKQFACNVFGQVEVTKAFLPLIRLSKLTQTRRILFISSGVGKFTFANGGPYCATKHAVESIASAFRMELRSWSIDVAIIEPGAIATEFTNTFNRTLDANITEIDSKVMGKDVAERYGKFINNVKQLNAKRGEKGHVSKVSDAIEASLFDSSPFARYVAGNDVQLLFAFTKLPCRVQDALFGAKSFTI